MFDADYDWCGDNVKPAGPGDAICGACEFPCEKEKHKSKREYNKNLFFIERK